MAKRGAFVWTPEGETLLGTMSDSSVGKKLGLLEGQVRTKRKKMGVEAFRTSQQPVTVACHGCGKPTVKRNKQLKRCRRLFCTRECANAGQKKRDTDMLRYGPGWKKRREEILKRDGQCRVCGKTTEQLGHKLHVHHLKPFRLGGSNHPENLVSLCDSCHHIVEYATTAALDAIRIDVKLEGSFLTIKVEGETRLHRYVAGVANQTKNGLMG